MTDKAKSESPEGEDKEKAITSKVIVLKRLEDGSVEALAITGTTEKPPSVSLDEGEVVASKSFKVVPKHLEFLFEKNFKGAR